MTSRSTKRLRAEWERHNVVLMAFPHDRTDWARYDDWEAVTAPFVHTAQAIAYYQMVYMLCRDCASIKPLFCSTTNIIFIEADYNDTWTRDYGPLSIEENGGKKLLDFTFDGWGGKFDATLDDRVNRLLASKGFYGGTPLESIDYVLEGGSIDTDGAGTVLTTASCLCHPARNGGQSKTQIEAQLHTHLGTSRVLWLDHGWLAGDDTDGHVDMLARFVNPTTIAHVTCDNPDDEHYDALQAMEEQLRTFRTQEGEPYTLVALPMPAPITNAAGERLPASYANFLITNGAVVYPAYRDPKDKAVGEILRNLFPDREVIPVRAHTLIEQGGSLHCSTMQIAF